MRTDLYNATVELDWLHHRAHEGKLFTVIDSGAAVVTSRVWLIKNAAAARPIHIKLFGLCAVASTFSLYEAPTFTVDGSALTILSVNRGLPGPIPTGVTFFHTPTKSVNGTLLDVNGNIAAAPFTIPSLASEWILAPNTNYLLIEAHTGTVQLTVAAVLYEG